jgi:DNA-binding NarL/FixJ family response regulator
MMLRGKRGFELVGDAVDEAGAIDLLEREHPDVVLLDGDGDGLRLCSLLAARSARVLIYAVDPDEALGLGAGVAGAVGVIDKVAPAGELFAALRRAAHGLAAAA